LYKLISILVQALQQQQGCQSLLVLSPPVFWQALFVEARALGHPPASQV